MPAEMYVIVPEEPSAQFVPVAGLRILRPRSVNGSEYVMKSVSCAGDVMTILITAFVVGISVGSTVHAEPRLKTNALSGSPAFTNGPASPEIDSELETYDETDTPAGIQAMLVTLPML